VILLSVLRCFVFILVAIIGIAQAIAGESLISFSRSERAMIAAHGPWPLPVKQDVSNRASGQPVSIELGELLFFDSRLSPDNRFSCATCHQLERMYSDGQKTNSTVHTLDRNTLSIINLIWSRWFGWDGGSDSLWAQSILPIVASREMNASAEHVVKLLKQDARLSCGFRSAFAVQVADLPAEEVLVLVAKSLAAYQETLISGRSPFDKFRDALGSGDNVAAANFPIAAQRGLKIFVGKGKCNLCHFGPLFTSGEFADVGIPFFISKGVVDKGRYGGLQSLRKSPYNLLGRFNDDPARRTATSTSHVTIQHRNWGEFKIPSLRNVALTAPYMHNGSLRSLDAVVRHYSNIDEERLHSDGVKILQPLNLSEIEIRDLVAFLKSLTAPVIANRHRTSRLDKACQL
jgi:cytochrome c peroxidase